MSDKLALNYAKIGKAILREAVEQENETRQQLIIDEVVYIRRSIEQYTEALTRNADILAYHKARLSAVVSGEFQIDSRGKVTFTNTELQRRDKD